MKRLILATAVLSGLAATGPALADAVNGAGATGTAAVTVVYSLTITQTQALNFGAITSGAAGTVTLDPAANFQRAVGGGVGAVAADGGQAGTFQITGADNAAVNVVVGSAITGFAGGITGVTLYPTLPSRLQGKLAYFSVGGTLTIPAKTRPGQYTGTYAVAVNYP